MNPTPDLWVHEREAAELLAIKNSTIRTMRRDGRLTPGDHFIFATGTAGGPVSYNVTAIRQSMAERTKEMVEAEGVEPSSTVAKNGVIHRLSWFVIVIPTKLGSYNLSLTALLQ